MDFSRRYRSPSSIPETRRHIVEAIAPKLKRLGWRLRVATDATVEFDAMRHGLLQATGVIFLSGAFSRDAKLICSFGELPDGTDVQCNALHATRKVARVLDEDPLLIPADGGGRH